MIQSMTGFGSAQTENQALFIYAEVKSLNSKFQDIYCRVPKNYSEHEIEIRGLLMQYLERGKIEFNLTVQPKDAAHAGTAINKPLVKAYFQDLQETARELGFEGDKTEFLRIATQMPNAFQTSIQREEDTAEEWALLKETILKAIEKCQAFRLQEGRNAAAKFNEYIDKIAQNLDKIIAHDPQRIPAVRERLERAVQELMQNESFDRSRFEQELIYYFERFDISEEKVRLKNHLDYFRQELNTASNGKKMNFIAQEIGREINTIGSKANDALIQRLVVQMKEELEKIKEQTLNIL